MANKLSTGPRIEQKKTPSLGVRLSKISDKLTNDPNYQEAKKNCAANAFNALKKMHS